MEDALSNSVARRRVAITAVTVGTVVSAFEGTVVTSAMPTIVHDLGGLEAYGWVFSAFLAASTLALLVCGKLADSIGRRPVFVGGMALFLVGSVLCGASTSFGALVAFRALQGLGAGALQPIAMTIGADLYRLEERAKIQAFSTAVWGTANVIGPVIGGFIVEHASWRWVFLVNVPIGIIAVVLLVASYRDPPNVRKESVGAGGAFLAGSATALAAFALAPQGLHAASARVAIACIAVLAVAAFIRHQRRAASPLLPSSALSEPAVQAGLVMGTFIGSILYACAAYVPLWVTARGRGGAVAAGLTLVPLLAGWALGASSSVRLLMAHGMRAISIAAFAIAFVGAVALAGVVALEEPTAWALASLGVMGLGLGLAASTSIIAPQSCVPWRYRGAVTSAVFAARMLGGSIAVAALGAAGVAGGDAWRFAGVALLALGGAVASAVLSPRALRTAPAEVFGSAAE
jgi:MFS family permease